MIKTQNFNSKLIILLVFVLLNTYYLILATNAVAVSPTPTTIKPTPTKTTVTPTGRLSPTPTTTDDAKVKEIRDSAKATVTEMRKKIEKRAYVGVISQITDSTITLDNFRGKQRVRLAEETTIIASNKKEIKAKDLALDDKVIALGLLGENDILEAKRVVVIEKPKNPAVKRVVLLGLISAINGRTSTITVTPTDNLDKSLEFKVDRTTNLSSSNTKQTVKFTDLKENQKVIFVYPETAEGKTITPKLLFVLP